MGSVAEVRVIKATSVDASATAILHEYCESIGVVKRDKPGEVEAHTTTHGSGLWLAYIGDRLIGCVVLRPLDPAPESHAGECKRLYVRPEARGRGVADKMLDVLEDYARQVGTRAMYLDSKDDLKAAIRLYERRGYTHCERYNDNPQATLFLRKDLTARTADG